MDASYILSVAVAAKHITGDISAHRLRRVQKARDRTDDIPERLRRQSSPRALPS